MGKKTNRIYYVKSDWIPQFQPSVALESYLEEVISRKLQLAEIKKMQPVIRRTKSTTVLKEILNNVKKADKGRL